MRCSARSLLAACALSIAGAPAVSEIPGQVASAELLSGWRDSTGAHISAIRIRLAPGWKTYWRAPGDAGIPPYFDWSASRNVAGVTPSWPVPHVFWQNGLRSVGYADEVVIPLTVAPVAAGEIMELAGRVDIGVCEDVCVPISFDMEMTLDTGGRHDPVIAAALLDRPVPASAAGVTSITCSVEPISDGIRLTAAISMPPIGPEEVAVLELSDPAIWISEAVMSRDGGMLTATADMVPPNGRPFAVDRSEVRVTVIAGDRAVDIRGCSGG
jgi:DsbC/DsbD-like thiol-disulfide interchange protein